MAGVWSLSTATSNGQSGGSDERPENSATPEFTWRSIPNLTAHPTLHCKCDQTRAQQMIVKSPRGPLMRACQPPWR